MLSSRPAPSWVAAAALPLLLVVGACAPAAPASPAAAPPPPDLARFYDQELRFGSCDGYATTAADEAVFASRPDVECTRLEVPLDYADPGGPTGRVAMLRVPARGESQGSLLVNSGGPGGAGMGFAVSTAAALATSAVTESFDIVGFDPRGVGATAPAVECFTPGQYREGDTTTEFIFSAGTWTPDDARRLTEQCAERSGGEGVLASVGTRDTVRDMDVLRAALGRERLDFLGQSYGTRMGALYAETFPQNVRTMVLDGAVDPRAGNERRLAQYTGFQQSFDRMAADCATSPDCPLGTDPARATERFQQIVRPLLDHPVPYGDGRQFTYTDTVNATIAALYSPASWPAIPRGLTELQDGDPSRLVRLIELFAGREPDGRGANLTSANLAITCMDEQRMTPEQTADLRARIYAMAPFADPGRGTDGALDACTAWPTAPKATYPLPERIEGLAPTLTISLTRDPTTPYDGAVRMSEMLDGSLLTVDGDGHTIAASGTNPCVNQVVADYLQTGRPPADDVRCAT
ncbi:alpha/beta hydrolase [Pseudonocardia sp. HH130629-09]|uniref:alpha/beta hydrolase n=1 Tax=Pseudonocardia sp. HH130629-09 TaxID=1641402 RepID=UPI0006CB7AA4|nr:alpha/beta hydrolase [Pseudonocardia sp. HH130629-09]ALE82820.1 carboxylesterase [Pseudonocardia sp. HH130629-09]